MLVKVKFVKILIGGLFHPLTTHVSHHIESSPLICIANQLPGFCMMGEHWSLMG